MIWVKKCISSFWILITNYLNLVELYLASMLICVRLPTIIVIIKCIVYGLVWAKKYFHLTFSLSLCLFLILSSTHRTNVHSNVHWLCCLFRLQIAQGDFNFFLLAMQSFTEKIEDEHIFTCILYLCLSFSLSLSLFNIHLFTICA